MRQVLLVGFSLSLESEVAKEVLDNLERVGLFSLLEEIIWLRYVNWP